MHTRVVGIRYIYSYCFLSNSISVKSSRSVQATITLRAGDEANIILAQQCCSAHNNPIGLVSYMYIQICTAVPRGHQLQLLHNILKDYDAKPWCKCTEQYCMSIMITASLTGSKHCMHAYTSIVLKGIHENAYGMAAKHTELANKAFLAKFTQIMCHINSLMPDSNLQPITCTKIILYSLHEGVKLFIHA